MKYTMPLALSLSLLFVSACGNAGASADAPASPAAFVAQLENLSESGNPGEPENLSEEERTRREAFQAIIGQQPDVQGVITQVVGNEITLALVEPITTGLRQVGEGDAAFGSPPDGAPAGGDGTFFRFEGNPGETQEGQTAPNAGQRPEGQMQEGQRPVGQMQGGQRPEGQMPGGQRPEGQMPNGQGRISMENMTEEDIAALRERMAQNGGARLQMRSADAEIPVTYTGEEITLTIPPALTFRSGMNMLTASELSKKQVLSLWMDEEDTVVYGMILGKEAQEDTP